MKRSSFLRGFTIQQRLPLLICLLLLSTVIAIGIASYYGVKHSSQRMAAERLQTVAAQLGNIYGQTAASAINITHAIAEEETIKNYMLQRGSIADSTVKKIMQRLQSDAQALYIELLDTNRQRLVRTGIAGMETHIDNNKVLDSMRLTAGEAKVSPMYRVGDSLYYAIAAAVTYQQKIIGYLIRWRLVFTTPAAIKQFSQLLGTDATIFVGNTDNAIWSDLLAPIDAPPVDIQDTSHYYTYTRQGAGPVIATARAIPNTDWVLLVEFSQQSILLAAKNFAVWIILIGSIITMVGLLIALQLSRNITRPLETLTKAAAAVAAGNYTTTVPVKHDDELGALARAFNTMSAEINNATYNLEEKVRERTAQVERMTRHAEEARQLRIQQKLVTETSIKVQEREREEIGKELHDNINQLLAAAKMYLGTAVKKDNLHSERLQQVDRNISRAIDEIRKLSKALVLPSIGDITWVQVIEGLLHDIKANTEMEAELYTKGFDESRLHADIKLMLYRIVQEQLNNILKHAKAKKVTITAHMDSTQLTLCIQDDGIGFDTQSQPTGIGLRNITDRANHYDGTVTIHSAPGKGCQVQVKLPL